MQYVSTSTISYFILLRYKNKERFLPIPNQDSLMVTFTELKILTTDYFKVKYTFYIIIYVYL